MSLVVLPSDGKRFLSLIGKLREVYKPGPVALRHREHNISIHVTLVHTHSSKDFSIFCLSWHVMFLPSGAAQTARLQYFSAKWDNYNVWLGSPAVMALKVILWVQFGRKPAEENNDVNSISGMRVSLSLGRFVWQVEPFTLVECMLYFLYTSHGASAHSHESVLL